MRDPPAAAPPQGSSRSSPQVFSFRVRSFVLVGRQQVDIINDTDYRRIDRGAGTACSCGRGRPSFLRDHNDVAFASGDRVERETSVFHVLALGRYLPA